MSDEAIACRVIASNSRSISVAWSESPPASKKSSSMPKSEWLRTRTQIAAIWICSGSSGWTFFRTWREKSADSCDREILPVVPLGRAGRIWTCRGIWNGARRSRRNSTSADDEVSSVLSFKTTAAATLSPSRGWGTAKAAASRTAGCCSSIFPTSYGDIFSPPRLMISLVRPAIVRMPSASTTPRSPVARQPSTRPAGASSMSLRYPGMTRDHDQPHASRAARR